MPPNGQFVKELPAMCLRDSNDALYLPRKAENHLWLPVFICKWPYVVFAHTFSHQNVMPTSLLPAKDELTRQASAA